MLLVHTVLFFFPYTQAVPNCPRAHIQVKNGAEQAC